MKTNNLHVLLMSLMALVACTDITDNPPDKDPTDNGTTEQGDYLVFREYTRVDGPLPDAPERRMEFNFKDSIYVVTGDDFLGSVAVKIDPQEAVSGFYFAVSGSEDNYYYDVPATPWMSFDSVTTVEIGVYPPEEAGVVFPFSTEIHIVPYGVNGPLKRTIAILTAEESVITPEKPATFAEVADKLKTKSSEKWVWNLSVTFEYGKGLSPDNAMWVVPPGHVQLYRDYDWSPAPPAELDGCCTPDGLSHNAGAYMGIYGECDYASTYLKTLPYSNQYIRDYEEIEFPSGGTAFLREIKSRTRNVAPSESDFCAEEPGYRLTDFQQHSNGDYTYDPATRTIEFNTMGAVPERGGWGMPSGEISELTDHSLYILVGPEVITRVHYTKIDQAKIWWGR
ncbi:MAG TPA: hypothetical protein VFZ52_11300 [Chryseolinea sp.]